MAQPINRGDVVIDKSKLAAFAPAQTVEYPVQTGPVPGAITVPRDALTAYIPPPAPAAPVINEQTLHVGRMLPIGGCQHPIGERWADEALDVEGCTRCGLAQIFRPGQGLTWEQNDEWTLAARKARVVPAG